MLDFGEHLFLLSQMTDGKMEVQRERALVEVCGFRPGSRTLAISSA